MISCVVDRLSHQTSCLLAARSVRALIRHALVTQTLPAFFRLLWRHSAYYFISISLEALSEHRAFFSSSSCFSEWSARVLPWARNLPYLANLICLKFTFLYRGHIPLVITKTWHLLHLLILSISKHTVLRFLVCYSWITSPKVTSPRSISISSLSVNKIPAPFLSSGLS